ncbi:MAG: NDP-sugar synthase [Chloroflexi bacterium]|nr:NDP-sugar synthase [Chloroflexota bacterium]
MGQRQTAPLKAVILVGGEGTRLRPLTYYTPKAMVPVLNHPFLEHTMAYLGKHGIGDIILAVSYIPEAIQGYFGDGGDRGVRLTYSVEDTPLGTAGAIKNAEQHLDGTFVVLNGDIFTDIDIADMLAFHRRRRAKVTMALAWVDNPCAFGMIDADSEGRVGCFTEKPSPEQVTSQWINAGIYILEPEILEHVPANTPHMFEKELFPLLLERGEPIYGYASRGYWIDMGTPAKYLCLNYDLLQSRVGSALTGSLNSDEVRCESDISVHPSARLVGPVVVGEGCRIGREACIKGPVAIGPGCSIGEGAAVETSIIWSGVDIGAGVSVRQCIIVSGTAVESNERLANCVVTPDRERITGLAAQDIPSTSF